MSESAPGCSASINHRSVGQPPPVPSPNDDAFLPNEPTQMSDRIFSDTSVANNKLTTFDFPSPKDMSASCQAESNDKTTSVKRSVDVNQSSALIDELRENLSKNFNATGSIEAELISKSNTVSRAPEKFLTKRARVGINGNDTDIGSVDLLAVYDTLIEYSDAVDDGEFIAGDETSVVACPVAETRASRLAIDDKGDAMLGSNHVARHVESDDITSGIREDIRAENVAESAEMTKLSGNNLPTGDASRSEFCGISNHRRPSESSMSDNSSFVLGSPEKEDITAKLYLRHLPDQLGADGRGDASPRDDVERFKSDGMYVTVEQSSSVESVSSGGDAGDVDSRLPGENKILEGEPDDDFVVELNAAENVEIEGDDYLGRRRFNGGQITDAEQGVSCHVIDAKNDDKGSANKKIKDKDERKNNDDVSTNQFLADLMREDEEFARKLSRSQIDSLRNRHDKRKNDFVTDTTKSHSDTTLINRVSVHGQKASKKLNKADNLESTNCGSTFVESRVPQHVHVGVESNQVVNKKQVDHRLSCALNGLIITDSKLRYGCFVRLVDCAQFLMLTLPPKQRQASLSSGRQGAFSCGSGEHGNAGFNHDWYGSTHERDRGEKEREKVRKDAHHGSDERHAAKHATSGDETFLLKHDGFLGSVTAAEKAKSAAKSVGRMEAKAAEKTAKKEKQSKAKPWKFTGWDLFKPDALKRANKDATKSADSNTGRGERKNNKKKTSGSDGSRINANEVASKKNREISKLSNSDACDDGVFSKSSESHLKRSEVSLEKDSEKCKEMRDGIFEKASTEEFRLSNSVREKTKGDTEPKSDSGHARSSSKDSASKLSSKQRDDSLDASRTRKLASEDLPPKDVPLKSSENYSATTMNERPYDSSVGLFEAVQKLSKPNADLVTSSFQENVPVVVTTKHSAVAMAIPERIAAVWQTIGKGGAESSATGALNRLQPTVDIERLPRRIVEGLFAGMAGAGYSSSRELLTQFVAKSCHIPMRAIELPPASSDRERKKRDRSLFDPDTFDDVTPPKQPRTSEKTSSDTPDRPPKPEHKSSKSHTEPTRHKNPDGSSSDRNNSTKICDDKKRSGGGGGKADSIELLAMLAAATKNKKGGDGSGRDERTKDRKSSEADSRPARLGFVIPKKRPIEYSVSLDRLRQEEAERKRALSSAQGGGAVPPSRLVIPPVAANLDSGRSVFARIEPNYEQQMKWEGATGGRYPAPTSDRGGRGRGVGGTAIRGRVGGPAGGVAVRGSGFSVKPDVGAPVGRGIPVANSASLTGNRFTGHAGVGLLGDRPVGVLSSTELGTALSNQGGYSAGRGMPVHAGERFTGPANSRLPHGGLGDTPGSGLSNQAGLLVNQGDGRASQGAGLTVGQIGSGLTGTGGAVGGAGAAETDKLKRPTLDDALEGMPIIPVIASNRPDHRHRASTPPWVRIGSRDPLGLEMPLGNDPPLAEQMADFSPIEMRDMDYRSHPVDEDNWVEDSSPSHSYPEPFPAPTPDPLAATIHPPDNPSASFLSSMRLLTEVCAEAMEHGVSAERSARFQHAYRQLAGDGGLLATAGWQAGKQPLGPPTRGGEGFSTGSGGRLPQQQQRGSLLETPRPGLLETPRSTAAGGQFGGRGAGPSRALLPTPTGGLLETTRAASGGRLSGFGHSGRDAKPEDGRIPTIISSTPGRFGGSGSREGRGLMTATQLPVDSPALADWAPALAELMPALARAGGIEGLNEEELAGAIWQATQGGEGLSELIARLGSTSVAARSVKGSIRPGETNDGRPIATVSLTNRDRSMLRDSRAAQWGGVTPGGGVAVATDWGDLDENLAGGFSHRGDHHSTPSGGTPVFEPRSFKDTFIVSPASTASTNHGSAPGDEATRTTAGRPGSPGLKFKAGLSAAEMLAYSRTVAAVHEKERMRKVRAQEALAGKISEEIELLAVLVSIQAELIEVGGRGSANQAEENEDMDISPTDHSGGEVMNSAPPQPVVEVEGADLAEPQADVVVPAAKPDEAETANKRRPELSETSTEPIAATEEYAKAALPTDSKALEELVINLARNALKPHYHKGKVTSQEYKVIMRKAIAKITTCKSGEITEKKVTRFINAYVEKVVKMRI